MRYRGKKLSDEEALERRRAAQRKYYHANKEKYAKYAREHREQKRESSRKWKAANADKVRAYNERYNQSRRKSS